jgi:SAM-dependent methyltransferase
MLICEKILNLSMFRKILNIISMLVQLGGLKKNYYLNSNSLDDMFTSFAYNKTGISLDIGSGPVPRNPFKAGKVLGADLRGNEKENVLLADFSSGLLPFESEMFDYVTAYDVLEHIQRVVLVNGETSFPFIILINEVFRVLRPGGIFFSIQPCFPAKQVFKDPTHINIMTEDTLYQYFCEPAWGRIYGYDGSFEMRGEGWLGCKYFAFMRKSADHPIRDLGFVQK